MEKSPILPLPRGFGKQPEKALSPDTSARADGTDWPGLRAPKGAARESAH